MVFPPRSDPEWLAEAIELARRCPPSDSAFAVGAWIVGADGRPVASGYSRELDDKVHAEEAALRKAATDGLNVEGAVLYSSMEPCSVRLSGRPSCCEHIRRAGIGRVVYAQSEPPLFVRCQGKAQLLDAGVQVSEIGELAQFAAALSAPAGISRA
ncbi:MAG: dCMP deaminase [Armatimonadetes bacterium]|nr:dCMP deaminase [Armatimonadota bacterium]